MLERKNVLNGHGFVEVVNFMGGDSSVVDAARVSFGGDLTEHSEERNKKLIRYLLKNGHTSPFEHVQFTFHIRAPIFVARQWMRHRTWSFNEVSARYTELEEGFYMPDAWRGQSDDNKQASDGLIDNQEEADLDFASAINASFSAYHNLLDLGVSRELARTVLPLAVNTRFYGTVDLHNLLKFIELRDHPHAQQEIREYAVAIREMLEVVVPWTMETWKELRSRV